jgi:hypothetical protein
MSNIEPVKKQITVNTAREHAFKVFTAGINRWWPREHHIGKSPLKEILLEQRAGGRWYSVCEDGSECDVGKVLSWEPPGRLLLAWQINAEWKYDPQFVTEVELTFTALTATQTEVTLEHRDLERFGEKAAELRKMIGSPTGWGKIMDEFAKSSEAA